MNQDVLVYRSAEVTHKNAPDAEGKVVEMLAKSKNFEGLMVTLEPHTEFGKAYAHKGEEIRFVLEGRVEFDIGGKRYLLKKGDCIWHKSETPHSLRNPGTKRARYFVVIMPPSFS
jgi:mannose-6-phosphate isomerase-like protein (cupin superfamily)